MGLNKKLRLEVWNKTNGFCWYCVKELVFDFGEFGSSCNSTDKFSVDHIKPDKNNKLENLVPCCRGCNSAKGTKTVEEFRLRCEIGIWFGKDQIEYLRSFGIEIPKRKSIVFYGETL